MRSIIIYTDGGCSGNPGPGGWGFAHIENEKVFYSESGFSDLTTNNQMELSAALFSLKYISKNIRDASSVTIHTDSAYTMNSMKNWAHNWKKNNWKKSNGNTIENLNLIKELYSLCYDYSFTVNWVKVKAHQKFGTKHYDPFNDYVDQLATGKIKPTSFK